MSVDLRKRTADDPDDDTGAKHEYVWRVYRIKLEAYHSRAAHPGSFWVVDVWALDRDDAMERLYRWSRSGLRSPVGATERGMCTHAQPCFLDHRERMSYPEWRVLSVRPRRGPRGVSQKRRPMVWLGRGTSVVPVLANSYRHDPAGEREPVLVWEFSN